MTVRLRLLDRVAWAGTDIPGDRPAALLAVLAAYPAGLGDKRIVDAVWGDEPPERPTKALQVLVSRLRSLDRSLVVRVEGGYRLGLAAEEVDAGCLHLLLDHAERALREGDAAAALETATRARATTVAQGPSGPLGDLRADARRRLRAADRVVALATARDRRHEAALPGLRELHGHHPDDVEVLAELLRAEAAVLGTATALRRYDAYRRDLADRTGLDPDAAVQRVHRELLAADAPVQTGVRYDADELLGREEDLTRLRTAMATGRLTTILGPGGIGKTRIAHVLAREATQPRVHVVELVGVGSGDDVVAEVGAALGVRGSVTSRRALTPAQQADVRARIAQELDSGPALLVLDNCEHVLEATAGLVAFLLVTTRDLHVLTTSRAPLRIAAERVVPLTQLAPDHAADLFRRRAQAVRPTVELRPETVGAVVARLDGLPLAIELAAARLRTMSAEEVRAQLDDRFGLLRSRDRAAPERHRTLTAVIEWSWDLLDDREREAAARLSVFHDGFDGATARSVLGADGMDLVEALADQSLVTVSEADGSTRFRMLETIREYAGLRLVASGAHDDALERQDRWARQLSSASGSVFFVDDQAAVVDALLAEENTLTDVLRRALGRGDGALTALLLRTLGSLWTVTGNHPRFFAVADAAQELLADWDPDPGDDAAREAGFEALALLLVHLSWIPGRDTTDIRAAMLRWGQTRNPWARAARAMFLDDDATTGAEVAAGLAALAAAEREPVHAAMLLLWASINAENVGDVEAAAGYARQALDLGAPTTYLRASLHAQLSSLAMHLGDHHTAARHAEVAAPLMTRLHAHDDASSLRLTVAVSMLLDGDLEGCEQVLAQLGDLPEGAQLGSRMLHQASRAEVALARGEVAAGFAHYDRAVDEVGVDLPGWTAGLTPWLLIAASAALTAHVRHAPPGPDPRADELRDLLLSRAPTERDGTAPLDDLPLSGVLLVAAAAWQLRHGGAATHEDGIRLLAIAHRWAYNRSLPSLSWEPLAAMAEQARPGRLDALLAEVAGRSGPDLVPDALRLLAGLRATG